jgi:hypothetical protein
VNFLDHQAAEFSFDGRGGRGCLVAEGGCHLVITFAWDADGEEEWWLGGGRFVSVSTLGIVKVGWSDGG